MSNPNRISADFPFESRFVEVQGVNMHYVEAGSGDPILFLHGNPTSSYLWRNIIPHLEKQGRCIAPDLVGFGKSEKPALEYRFFDHYQYVEGFIKALDLQNLTLVIHDWGSGLGFHYAMQNENNVKGIAFMEAILMPATWDDFPREFKITFKLFRTRGVGWFMIGVLNLFVEMLLPQAIVRKLSKEEMVHYREPFRKRENRVPVWRWPNEIPIEGEPADVHAAVKSYCQKLQQSQLPKLLFYAHPGGIIREAQVAWCREHLPNLETVDIGEGIHYLQEDHPHLIGSELAKWYARLPK